MLARFKAMVRGAAGQDRARESPSPIAAPQPPAVAPRAFAVERHALCLADLSREALRSLITELDTRADSVGCVVIDDGNVRDRAAVIFAGNLERFHMLAAARGLRCPVVYVQDVQSWWYQGSDLLPDLEEFCRHFLVRELGSVPALFFGQSSGAYAALIASTFFKGSTLLACAPQTFSDAAAKARFTFVGVRAHHTPDNLVDARAALLQRPDPTATRTVVIAVSESGNPVTAHYWMDYLHALRLADVPDVEVAIVNCNSHAVVHGRSELFSELLAELVSEIALPGEQRSEIVARGLARIFAG